MFLIEEKMYDESKFNIPSKNIWEYLGRRWKIEEADLIENITFDTSEKEFNLPNEYKHLITEQNKIIKKTQVNEFKKKTSLHNPFKTKYKFKSISSVNSKDIFNEVVPSTLSDSPVRTCENRPEKMFSLRRLLRTNDKPKEEQNIEHDSSNKRKCLRINYKPIDSNKLNDFKLLNKKQSNQSKEFKKNKKIAMVKGRKLKNCYESEPNFNSSNSKQFENNKNNITDLTISDTLFRLVTPQILRGKTPNQSSIATEMVDRKSIPPSNNKDQESNISLEKACIKLDHCVDLILPHIVLERLKADQFEKQSASLIDYKPKYLTPNKIESFHIFKEKTKGRISSNLLVTQQSLNVQGEDMRSNSKTS